MTATNIAANGVVSIDDVKASGNVYREWSNGDGGSEYFLIENRQKTGYDASLPGAGLLIWHIDDAQPDNSDDNHYKVALVQSDGRRDLELDRNRGDNGDPYPGASITATFDATSSPNSNSHSNQPTGVAITSISSSAPSMTAMIAITGAPAAPEEDWVEAVAALDARVAVLEKATRQAGPGQVFASARRPAHASSADGGNGVE